jgi:hypothetical protein
MVMAGLGRKVHGVRDLLAVDSPGLKGVQFF